MKKEKPIIEVYDDDYINHEKEKEMEDKNKIKERKRILRIIEKFHKEKFGCSINCCIPIKEDIEIGCYFKQLKDRI